MTFDLLESRAILARTPGLFRAWFEGLPDGWLACDEGPGTYSPRDVLAHLIHGERTDWIPRLRMILDVGEGEAFPPFQRDGFQDEARTWPLERLLGTFEAERAASLAALDAAGLAAADLGRRGRHPAFGPVTLRQLLATWAVHDLGHVAQAARVMAKRYASDVGPWRAYLPVLSR